MKSITLPIIAVVTRETRLESLKARWATTRAAAFRLEQAVGHEVERRKQRLVAIGRRINKEEEQDLVDEVEALADGSEYQSEDVAYQRSVAQLMKELDLGFPVKKIDRAFVPNFDFGRCMVVVIIGQDGLVANTAKYVGDLPIVAVNPDPSRYDGVLLPFSINGVRNAVRRVLDRRAKTREITLGEVNTNDGQRMLAFNDFFVGNASHVSARYTIETTSGTESQSSSGVLIATGAGSTGWLSSMFNMVTGFCQFAGGDPPPPVQMAWEERRLMWAVREPFLSRHSSANLVAGMLGDHEELVIGSQMPLNGVIFSDGIESDFLEFNSGTIARFTVSKQRARLVI